MCRFYYLGLMRTMVLEISVNEKIVGCITDPRRKGTPDMCRTGPEAEREGEEQEGGGEARQVFQAG